MTLNWLDRPAVSGLWAIAFVLSCSACISGDRFVCYDGSVVDDMRMCPKQGAGNTLPAEETTTTTLPVLTTLPPLRDLSNVSPGVYYSVYYNTMVVGDFSRWWDSISTGYKRRLNNTANGRIEFEGRRSEIPKNITMLRENTYTDSATLDLRGLGRNMQIGDETRLIGVVRMVREDNMWKIHHERWRAESEYDIGGGIWDVEHHCNNLPDARKCNEVSSSIEKTMCFSCFAKLDDKPALCEDVTFEALRDDCFMYFAQKTGDVKYCQRLSSDRIIQECVETVR